jgi:hypothetical protein
MPITRSAEIAATTSIAGALISAPVAPHLTAREAGGDTVNDKNFGEGVAWLGILLDESANSAARLQLSAQASRVQVYVIAADEERMIAEHTVKHIG